MAVDIPNTLTLWGVIGSVSLSLLTLVAFILAYSQWLKDNFLKSAQELLKTEADYSLAIESLVKDAPFQSEEELENRRKAIIDRFLNSLDMYAFYFFQKTVGRPMLVKYFKKIFLAYWDNPYYSAYIASARAEDPGAYLNLETFVIFLKQKKHREDSHG